MRAPAGRGPAPACWPFPTVRLAGDSASPFPPRAHPSPRGLQARLPWATENQPADGAQDTGEDGLGRPSPAPPWPERCLAGTLQPRLSWGGPLAQPPEPVLDLLPGPTDLALPAGLCHLSQGQPNPTPHPGQTLPLIPTLHHPGGRGPAAAPPCCPQKLAEASRAQAPPPSSSEAKRVPGSRRRREGGK